jgi:intein-encoded DNA endonuclease-like protein
MFNFTWEDYLLLGIIVAALVYLAYLKFVKKEDSVTTVAKTIVKAQADVAKQAAEKFIQDAKSKIGIEETKIKNDTKGVIDAITKPGGEKPEEKKG